MLCGSANKVLSHEAGQSQGLRSYLPMDNAQQGYAGDDSGASGQTSQTRPRVFVEEAPIALDG